MPTRKLVSWEARTNQELHSGKNVCSPFLIGLCGLENRCNYSHSKTHLPPGGWWEDDQAIADCREVEGWLDDEDAEYHELHSQLLEHPKANGFAARREWAELRLHIDAQYETILNEEKTAKNHKLPAPPTESFVLVVSFDYHRGDYDSDASLLASVARKVKVVDTGKSSNGRGPEMAIQHLDSPHIVAVLLIDAYVVTKPEHTKVAQKLVSYAKNGGTVVMAGQLPSHMRPDDFNRAMKNTWGMNWQSGSYFRSTFQLNSAHDIAKRNPKLVDSYSMKALHLVNIQAKDAVYAENLPANEAPVVYAKLGQGFVGYVGDVNSETSSETVIMAMLGVLDTQKSRSLPADKFVLIISFDYEGIFEGIHEHLFSEMERKLKVVHVRQASNSKGPETALEHLESPSLVGVLVTDPAVVTEAKYSKVTRKLVSYAQAGGNVVLGGQLVSNIRPNDLEKVFKTTWGLFWKPGSYFRSTFHLNQGSGVAQPNPSLPNEYSMKAVHISNISPSDAVYAATSTSYTQSAVFPPSKAKGKSKVDEAPVVCTQIGRGRFGFVGDVNGEEESTKAVMAILGILDELTPNQKIVEKQPDTATSPSRKEDSTPSKPTDKFVLILALGGSTERLKKLDAQLAELRKRVNVKTAETSRQALEYMADTNLHGVYVVDQSIADQDNIDVLLNMNDYAQRGGLVVFGGLFPVAQPRPDDISRVFSSFGLPWEAGSQTSCLAQLNEHHETAARNPELSTSYQLSALHLSEFRIKELFYENPDDSSDEWEAPILRTRVGRGRLGYIGDTNAEPGSTQVLLSMFELLSPNEGGNDSLNKAMLLICDFDEDDLEVVAPEFIEATEAKVQVLVGPHSMTRSRMLELLASPEDLVGVMVGDGCLLFPENASLLSRLVEYSKNGGTVVFCWKFGAEMSARKQLMGMFFSRWNLQWDMAGPSPVDSVFRSNTSNILFRGEKGDNIADSFNSKGAIYIKGITEKMAVYVPSEQPKIWNPSRKLYSTPFVFAEVGKGRVGYVGSGDIDGDVRNMIHKMFGLL